MEGLGVRCEQTGGHYRYRWVYGGDGGDDAVEGPMTSVMSRVWLSTVRAPSHPARCRYWWCLCLDDGDGGTDYRVVGVAGDHAPLLRDDTYDIRRRRMTTVPRTRATIGSDGWVYINNARLSAVPLRMWRAIDAIDSLRTTRISLLRGNKA